MASPETDPGEKISRGKVEAIRPAYEVGGEGSFPVAIIKGADGRGSWITLPAPDELSVGDQVTILSTTRTHGRGSETSYKVEQVSSEN